jgi:cold shock CspA family protein
VVTVMVVSFAWMVAGLLAARIGRMPMMLVLVLVLVLVLRVRGLDAVDHGVKPGDDRPGHRHGGQACSRPPNSPGGRTALPHRRSHHSRPGYTPDSRDRIAVRAWIGGSARPGAATLVPAAIYRAQSRAGAADADLDPMQIPLKINFHGLDRSEALEASVREWAAKLDSVYPRIQRCEVAIEAPHRHQRQGRQFHVRIDITVPDGEIVVSRDPGPAQAHEDPFVAVRDSFRAARRQLDDHVRRHLRGDVKTHEGPAHGRVTFLDAEREWGTLEADDGRPIYFHRNSVLGGVEKLELGHEVRFAEEAGDKGPQATTVAPVGAHGRHEVSGAA